MRYSLGASEVPLLVHIVLLGIQDVGRRVSALLTHCLVVRMPSS